MVMTELHSKVDAILKTAKQAARSKSIENEAATNRGPHLGSVSLALSVARACGPLRTPGCVKLHQKRKNLVREILRQVIFCSKFLSDLGPNRAVIQSIPGRIRFASAISLRFPRWIIQHRPALTFLLRQSPIRQFVPGTLKIRTLYRRRARGTREWWNWSLSIFVAGGWSATREAGVSVAVRAVSSIDYHSISTL
jgi:hypothetical protein